MRKTRNKSTKKKEILLKLRKKAKPLDNEGLPPTKRHCTLIYKNLESETSGLREATDLGDTNPDNRNRTENPLYLSIGDLTEITNHLTVIANEVERIAKEDTPDRSITFEPYENYSRKRRIKLPNTQT